MAKPSIVALIPARSGSKRIRDKNVRLLVGHPLIAYTISAALESKVFDAVVVSTDSRAYADIATSYGAESPFLRPAKFSQPDSPDIQFIDYTLDRLRKDRRDFDCFSILRPTSPFRLPETIQRAWKQFLAAPDMDSLRAVEKCKQHPGKMWVVKENMMSPLMPMSTQGVPWHSLQYPSLPEVYAQNASLEIAWSRVVTQFGTIAGNKVIPFFTQGFEGVDINDEKDFWWAEYLIAQKGARVPPVTRVVQKQKR